MTIAPSATASLRRVFVFVCPIVALTLLVPAAQAQTATAVIREGDVLGSFGAVSSINNPSVNNVGGYSVQLNTGTVSHIWGNGSGGAGVVIVSEGSYGGFLQTSFESFNGLNDRGETCYSPLVTEISTGNTGLDAAFLDTTPLLVERQPVTTLPGQFSVFNSRVGCTADEPYWVGGISAVQGGSTTNRVLFKGINLTPVLKGGDLIGGVNLPQSMTATLDFSVRFSRLGTHYALEAQVTGATSGTDQMMALDGNALVAGGGFVREGSPVPAAVGGLPGENWASTSFEEKGITETGKVFFTGDTSASTAVDEFVFHDGQIVLREGAVFAGPGGNYTISGAIESGYMNRQGDWAVTWDVNPPAGVNREALFVNGVMVLQENDLVDLTGDGVPDANGILRDFTGISSLVVGPRNAAGNVAVYFTADIDVNNTPTTSGDDVEALFRLVVPSGVDNLDPVAECQDVTVPAGAACTADADVNDGSSDPDDDPFTLGQSPAGPYPVGQTSVTLTVTDVQGATDTCLATVTVTSTCDDGNACTTDSCNPEGGCTNTPITCDDGDLCTTDSCDPDKGCVSEPVGPEACDDGDACTTESCVPGTGCVYEPVSCDDANACTVDSCNSDAGCQYLPVTCDDADACTEDSCDPGTGCVFDPTTAEEPNPRTIGYWKRLCQGPHSGDELLESDAACVAARGTTFSGVASVADICAVLLQGGQGGTCAHTEIDLLSLALNQCHVRVCGGNAIQSQYSDNTSVGESYAEADAILSDPDRDQQSCLVAKGLLEEINTGRALNLDTVGFAKVAGGGVRVSWQPPYAINPIKYNVWRREAGSLAPFQKIAETATPVFDDVTPGNYEYDISPVRE